MAGRYSNARGFPNKPIKFQSSPGLMAGRYFWFWAIVLSFQVSILARLNGRALPSAHRGTKSLLACFNPRPA